MRINVKTMHITLILCFLTFLLNSCKSTEKVISESESESLRYVNFVFKDYLSDNSIFLDLNSNRVSKKEFALLALSSQLIGGRIDSTTFKIIKSENHGKIRNPLRVFEVLKEYSSVNFNPQSPIVIIYYPGIDGCSETGFTIRSWTKRHFNNFETELQIIGQTKPFYFYKSPVESGKFKGIIDWEMDPKGAFEELFFPVHCPCGSFAIMGTNGDYYIKHGEYSKEFLLKMFKILNDG